MFVDAYMRNIKLAVLEFGCFVLTPESDYVMTTENSEIICSEQSPRRIRLTQTESTAYIEIQESTFQFNTSC